MWARYYKDLGRQIRRNEKDSCEPGRSLAIQTVAMLSGAQSGDKGGQFPRNPVLSPPLAVTDIKD
jgi:hypothetical protein